MSEQVDRREGTTASKEVISPQVGGEIVRRIAELAEERGYSGLGMVTNAAHELVSAQATGSGAHEDQLEIIKSKIQTVLASRRSVSVQVAYMKTYGRTREDYGGSLGSMIPGGVALFKDPDLKIFIGAAAYGGGPAAEDEFIVRQAAEEKGVYTDLRKEV